MSATDIAELERGVAEAEAYLERMQAERDAAQVRVNNAVTLLMDAARRLNKAKEAAR